MIAVNALCTFVVLASSGMAVAKVRTPSAADQLQAACYPDVQRLCKDAIPDEGRIRSCMAGKKSMVSAKCMKAYEASQD